MKVRFATVLAVLSLSLSATAWSQTTGSAAAAPAAPAAAPAKAAAAVVGKETAETGKAVYYSNVFNGRKTYSKERFNNRNMVAAHRTLPMGTLVKVVNLKNKKAVTVRIIDRGPSQPERVIDLSRAAAAKLGFLRAGITDVSLTVVGKAKAPRAKAGKRG